MNARVSLLGGIAVAKDNLLGSFQTCFNLDSGRGLYQRFTFGYAGADERCKWLMPPYPKASWLNGAALPVEVTQDLYARANEWLKGIEAHPGYEKRLSHMLMRIAMLSASSSKERHVTDACWEAARAFVEWQAAIRSRFYPGAAKSIGAIVSEWFENELRARAPFWIPGPELFGLCCRKTGASASEADREMRSLVRQGRVLCMSFDTGAPDKYQIAKYEVEA